MPSPKARNYRDSTHGTIGLECTDPSLAVQASKDETDINTIVKKYLRTGELPQVKQAAYLDLSEMVSLQDALHMADAAQTAFLELPADIRRRFDNDPVKLVAFAQDDRNYAEAQKLGLIPPSQPDPKPPVKDQPEPAAAGANTPTT